MVGLLLATLLAADDVTWHQDVAGKYRIGLSGGLDDRGTSAAERKAMLAGLEPWVAFFKSQLEPKGMDVLINKGAHGGSKVKDGPLYQNVDVMLFKYKSSPRWGNKVIPEDETGNTIYVHVNGVGRLGEVLYDLGKTEKGGAMFLAPEQSTRHGFTEYVITPTERALLLAPAGLELFVPVSRRELYTSLKKQYQERLDKLRAMNAKTHSERGELNAKALEEMQSKFEADHAGADLDAQAIAAPGILDAWPGLQPPRNARPVVKYNPKFFKTRTQRTAPHFAMVYWKCSHMQPQDLPWMEALVDRLKWEELAGKLVP